VSKPGSPLLWQASIVDSRVNKKEGGKCGKRTKYFERSIRSEKSSRRQKE
jgi:hypothetical protein